MLYFWKQYLANTVPCNKSSSVLGTSCIISNLFNAEAKKHGYTRLLKHCLEILHIPMPMEIDEMLIVGQHKQLKLTEK